jgi:anti-anti-sigma regulatory factor
MLAHPIRVRGDEMTGGSFDIRWAEGLPVVAAPAEIDTANADALRDALASCLDGGNATMVVDMTAALAAGGEVRLVVGAAPVMRVLALVGADQVLPIFTELDEALADAP